MPDTTELRELVKKLGKKANRQWTVNAPIYKAIFAGGFIKGYKANRNGNGNQR